MHLFEVQTTSLWNREAMTEDRTEGVEGVEMCQEEEFSLEEENTPEENGSSQAKFPCFAKFHILSKLKKTNFGQNFWKN